MESNYTGLLALIAQWQLAEKEHATADLKQFARWLLRQPPDANGASLGAETLEIDRQALASARFRFYLQLAPHQQMGALLVRLAKFFKLMIKQEMADLPITSADEFGFLAWVEQLGRPRKSDVVVANLNELTTGTEILRRLLRMGLLEEEPDLEDKRSKRVHLTPEGLEVIRRAKEIMSKASEKLFRPLDSEDRGLLLTLLLHLNEVHTEHYFQAKEGPLRP